MVKSWYPSRGDDTCVQHNIGGTPFEEFSCLYPTLGWTYTEYVVCVFLLCLCACVCLFECVCVF